MLVREVLEKKGREVIAVRPSTRLVEAMRILIDHKISCLIVLDAQQLVGIVSDRDLREHRGHLEQVKLNGVMTERPVTVTPATTIEEAAQIMLERQIGGLPVVADGRLVGIITASDIMRAFLDVMGASHGGSARIDFVLEGEERGFNQASRIISREGGEVLGVGTYRDKLGDSPVCYLRLLAGDPDNIAKSLRNSGFNVLGMHKIGGDKP